MARLIVREMRPGDLEAVAPRLREADRMEVEACTTLSMHDALATVINYSVSAWTIEVDGEPAGLFGVHPQSMLGGIGSPWMLGTPALETAASTLTREGRRYIRRMLDMFPTLINYTDVRNVKSIRWLRALGFSFDIAPQPYGLYGLPFYRFELRV